MRSNESIAGELVPFLSELNGATPPVVLPEADAARLFALRGSPADVLDPAEKLRLWQFVAGDVVFLSRTFAIRYEREGADARDTAARRAAFVDGAAAALPALSPPVREAFADYLARAGLAEVHRARGELIDATRRRGCCRCRCWRRLLGPQRGCWHWQRV